MLATTKKVGRLSDEIDAKTNKPKVLSYGMIKTDPDGWVSTDDCLPADYDLVQMKIGEKIISGWLSGFTWDGLHYRAEQKVDYWRRNVEEEHKEWN